MEWVKLGHAGLGQCAGLVLDGFEAGEAQEPVRVDDPDVQAEIFGGGTRAVREVDAEGEAEGPGQAKSPVCEPDANQKKSELWTMA